MYDLETASDACLLSFRFAFLAVYHICTPEKSDGTIKASVGQGQTLRPKKAHDLIYYVGGFAFVRVNF